MLNFVYPATFVPRVNEGIVVRFRDIPGALTSGADKAEARVQAADALEAAVLFLLAQGQQVPPPSDIRSEDVPITLDPVAAARVAFDQRRRALGLSKVEAAQRIGRDEKVVRRILDGSGSVRIETVLEALRALDAHPMLSLPDPEDAAEDLMRMGAALTLMQAARKAASGDPAAEAEFRDRLERERKRQAAAHT